MKKIITSIAILTSIVVISCSKEEIQNFNEGSVIDFRTTVTRATETTSSNLSNFYVTAITSSGSNYFTDLKFTGENTAYYKSEKDYFWPSDGSNIDFYAYAPSKTDLDVTSLTIDKTTQALTSFIPNESITNQKDFIVAKATGNKNDADDGVELIFDHVLSQIELRAYNSNTGYSIKVKGVRIGKVFTTADFSFTNKIWSNRTNKGNYELIYTDPRPLTDAIDANNSITLMPSANDNAMLIPQEMTAWDSENDKTNTSNGTYFAVLVNIKTAAGAKVFPKEYTTESEEGAFDWIAVPIAGEWHAGFKYVYNLDLANGGLIDPEKEPEDPDDPDDDDPDTPSSGTTGGPGSSVMGGEIKFTRNVDSWSINF